MYLDFLRAVVAYIEGLNAATAGIEEKAGLTPYLGRIPVLLDDELCGYLADEIGGEWCYQPATDQELQQHRNAKAAG